ncbi:MAG: hypothetical protein CENE_02036 [Candidatus Celerinatantimonas neptuna]|nr:MAG: hypothetical protein CENE_02036 [Candidatus Celerinatantimonas neptuna]
MNESYMKHLIILMAMTISLANSPQSLNINMNHFISITNYQLVLGR